MKTLMEEKIWETDRFRVLIVEDDPEVGLMVQSIFLNRGFVANIADSAKEAMALIHLFQPTVIICDIMMPRMDGFELCKFLKQSPDFSNIPVIFLSACKEPWVMEKAFSLGAKDFISKPFQITELMGSVSRLFSPYPLS